MVSWGRSQVALLQNQIALEELDNSGARVGEQGGEGERGGLSNGSASSTPSSMPGVLSLATPTTGNGDTPQHTPVPSTGERDGRNKEAKRLKMLRKWWAKSGADLSSAGTWAGKAGGAGAQALCPIVGEEAQRRAAAAGKGEGGQVSPWPLAGPDVGGGEVLWKVVVSPNDVGWRGEGAPGSCVFGTQRRQAYPVIDAGVEEGPGRAQKQWSGWLKCVAPPQVVALEQGGSLRSIAGMLVHVLSFAVHVCECLSLGGFVYGHWPRTLDLEHCRCWYLPHVSYSFGGTFNRRPSPAKSRDP